MNDAKRQTSPLRPPYITFYEPNGLVAFQVEVSEAMALDIVKKRATSIVMSNGARADLVVI